MRQKNWRLVMIAAFSIVLFVGCDPIHTNQEQEENSLNPGPGPGPTADTVQIFSQTLQPVLTRNCAQCHGSFQSPRFAVSDAASALQAINDFSLVDMNTPASSRFVTKIMGGHQSKSPAIATEIQNQIVEWKRRLDLAKSASDVDFLY